VAQAKQAPTAYFCCEAPSKTTVPMKAVTREALGCRPLPAALLCKSSQRAVLASSPSQQKIFPNQHFACNCVREQPHIATRQARQPCRQAPCSWQRSKTFLGRSCSRGRCACRMAVTTKSVELGCTRGVFHMPALYDTPAAACGKGSSPAVTPAFCLARIVGPAQLF
jgi:hypothetical protein